MKQQEVFNRIGGIINELNDQFKYLQDDPTKINELELELFVANAHFLANHADVLKKLHVHEQPALPQAAAPTAEPGAPITAPKEEKYFEPVVQKSQQADDSPVPQIDLSGEAPEDDYSYIRQSEPEIIKHELEIDDSWVDDEDEEIAEIPEVEPEPESFAPIPEKPVDVTPVAPLVVEKHTRPTKQEEPETLTINQRMSAQMPNKHEAASQPISDLKSAITLNDKLLFVKDLFNGYSLAYSEAIDILNKFNSFDEADKYLKGNYSAKNDWDSKPETREKFYALLRRRFA